MLSRPSPAMHRSALLLVFTFAPSIAHASAAPPPTIHLRDAIPSIDVEGALEVTEGEITIACGGFEFVDASFTCTIDATLRVHTEHGARLTRQASPESASTGLRDVQVIVIPDTHPDDVVLLGGHPLTDTAALTSGMTRTLTVHATRSLHGGLDTNEYLILAAALTRHPLMSESHTFDYDGDALDVSLLHGDVQIAGPVHLDARHTTGLEVRVGDERVNDVHALARAQGPIAFSITLSRERDYEGPIAQGGLSFLVGSRENLDLDEAARPLVAIDYEVVMEDFLFASLAVATDFESLLESLVLEVATPNILFLLPSLSAGVGIVARQLGERPADAALRLRFGATWPMLGAILDVDYWPDLGQWTMSAGLRIGL